MNYLSSLKRLSQQRKEVKDGRFDVYPTVAKDIDLIGIAKSCGYPNAVSVDNFDSLDRELEAAKNRNELTIIEVKSSIGARDNLGRPTTTALENKLNFMEYLKGKN